MFAAVFCRKAAHRSADYADAATLLSALTPFHQADRQGHWLDERMLLVQALTFNTPESQHECVPYVCPDTGRVIASWLRLDNRDALCRQLDIPGGQDATLTDPMLVLACYQQWGTACANRLEGDFSFVIYDPTQQCCFVARDSLGVKPLYYALTDEVFIVASSAAVFTRLRHFSPVPDERWMAGYLLGESMSFTATAYRNITKLAPAHALHVTHTSSSLQRYFSFVDDAPQHFRREQHWVDTYREQLERSVRVRLRSHYALGAETSGGIDSSTVLAYMARLNERPPGDLHAFGFATCELEPEFILETSRMYNIHHNHIVTGFDQDDEAMLDRSLAVLGYPVEHGNATAHQPFYQLCEGFGIRSLFSGFGGDEVVTNPGSLLPLELIDNKRYLTLYSILNGNLVTKPLRFANWLRKSRRHGGANPAFLQGIAQRWPHHVLRDEVVERFELKARYFEGATFDAPYRTINSFILNNRIVPFVPTRLDNCTLMAASYKVDYRWPLLDRVLMQQYLSTPAIEKWHGGMGRYLHRRAVDGLVPAKVLWKPGKDMGSPMARMDDGVPLLQYARWGRQIEAEWHPALDGLIDRDKLRQQISVAEQGGNRQVLPLFRKTINQLRQLNRWLNTCA